MKYDVFISYSHKDEKLARSLTKKLKDKGGATKGFLENICK